jgi:hypothetical protein
MASKKQFRAKNMSKKGLRLVETLHEHIVPYKLTDK